jgi:Flp pilus assembly protein CpaB
MGGVLIAARPQTEPHAVDPLTLASTQLSLRLPPGQVGIVLRLDNLAATGGDLVKGDHVQVYAYFPAASGAAGDTRELLSDRTILGITREGDATAVTLAVQPDQALSIQNATLAGAKPFVLLRSSAGLAGATIPTTFGSDDLPAWIARRGGSIAGS